MNLLPQLQLNPVIMDIITACSQLVSKSGNRAYIVGGYVRDLLLEREKSEVDILVIGDGPEFAKSCAKQLKVKRVDLFKRFGTAHFVYKGIDVEFVGARKESYSRDSRKPEVEAGSFEDDITRRDFTVNTLALSLEPDELGEVIDTFHGVDAIAQKILVTPLDPYATFDDDPLRIMRAFRFASQLGFSVHPDVVAAATAMKERLSIVSVERISAEFLKILESPKPSVGLILLFESGVLEVIFPEAARMGGVEQRQEYHHKDVFYHTCQVVDNLAEVSDNLWLRFAALVHDIAKPNTKRFYEGIGWTFHGHEDVGAKMMRGIFRRLRLPLHRLEYVAKLVKLHLRPIALAKEEVTDSAIRRLIVEAGEELDDLIVLCRADITSKNPHKVNRYLSNYDFVMERVVEVREKDALRAFQSPVRGETIMEVCKLPPSKLVGVIKEAIEAAILEGEIPNTYEAAYTYMLENKDALIEGYLSQNTEKQR